jgi:hypothetical protein
MQFPPAICPSGTLFGGMAHALPGGIEPRRPVVDDLRLQRRLRPRLLVFALAVAQPEHAGLGVGRVGHRVGDLVLLAPVERGAGDLVAETLGPLEQGADDYAVGDSAAAIHRVGEVGMGGDPVVDGAGGRRRRSRLKPRWWRRAGNSYGQVRNNRVCKCRLSGGGHLSILCS